jgi:hypothetical protein
VAIDLHPNAKARIAEIVAGALPLMDVDHGKFIRRASEGVALLVMADQALPQRGPIHDTLLAYVDDYPLVEFILDTLAIELQSAEYQKEPAQKNWPKFRATKTRPRLQRGLSVNSKRYQTNTG